MNVVVGTLLIWAAALAVLRHIARLDPGKLPDLWRAAGTTFLVLLPRTVIALSGASFMADLLPPDQVAALFGREQGLAGVLTATLAGGLTPGGPMVAFALAATALKAGAAVGPVLAYVTAWSIVSLTRTLGHELAIMGSGFLIRRLALSAPVPVLAGLAGMVLERVFPALAS